jgi:Fe-S oxidoreductase
MAREGNLEAPTRHAIDWKNPDFYNEELLTKELERVFEICHGCRRCFNLCESFPKLFDLIDETPDVELHSVDKKHYGQVVDHCYLCDMCYMTKCPYVPPHEWNLDFPHLMLRAKAVKFKQGHTKLRDRILTSTDMMGSFLGIPIIAQVSNFANKIKPIRQINEKLLGISADAILPEFHSNNLRKRESNFNHISSLPIATDQTTGKVALFVTCYGNRNEPDMAEDLMKVFEYNGIPVKLTPKEKCCGMPKLEVGDLERVKESKEFNIPILSKLIDEGFDIVAPIPSCALMFKQELPLLFPNDPAVAKVQQKMFDPFEYLMLRHKAGLLKTDFKNSLGKVSYHVPCHLRVQNIGLKTKEMLQLVPNTQVDVIERCSGHDGTYAVRAETHQASMKIVKPVVNKVKSFDPDYYGSDCPMAGHQIENGLNNGKKPLHPFSLLCIAYGLREK